MYKKVNVVMLPTNEKATICLSQNKLSLFYGIEPDIEKLKYQHIYIISDEEINGGDWCLNSYDNQIWKYKPSPCPLPYWGNKDTLTKIIATTDTSLELPQPPQQFIEKFIREYNKGNQIEEVMIEYVQELSIDSSEQLIEDLSLKINFDNTLSIRSKINWSIEEVEEILRKCAFHFINNPPSNSENILKVSNQWIKENL